MGDAATGRSAPTIRIAPADRDLSRSLAEPAVRAALQAQWPEALRLLRWFGGQTRQLTGVRIEGWLSLLDEPGAATLCVVAATDTAGLTTRHPLFLTVDEEGVVGEALALPAARRRLLKLLLAGGTIAGSDLRLEGEPIGTMPGMVANLPSRLVGVEQSNSAVIYGDRAFLKIYRRLESGENPEVELARYLAIEAGFPAVPRLLATGRLRGAGDFDAPLLILQEFVPGAGDGWAWALARAGAAFDAANDPDDLDRWLAAEGETLAAAADLGRITAQLHAALAEATAPDLRPIPATPADLATWVDDLHREAVATAATLARAGHADPALARAIDALARITPAGIADPGLQIRVHGDYHLGQVIRSDRGFLLLDFEGEPARPLAARRRRQHPLVDLAGMARSWNYAARVADALARPALAARWEERCRAALLNAYWAEADRAPRPFLPRDGAGRAALLTLFELIKALYEVRYELDNRPALVDIPGAAVKRLATGYSLAHAE